jgi:hypothetical protein
MINIQEAVQFPAAKSRCIGRTDRTLHIVNFPVSYSTTHLNQISITSNQSTSAPDTPAHDVPNTHGLNSRNDESTVGGSERPADIIRQELVRRVLRCPWLLGRLLILPLALLSLATGCSCLEEKKISPSHYVKLRS